MVEKALLAVDIIVLKDDYILLIKRKNEPYKGKYALPGGFVNEKERVEEAAIRELSEETGLYVTKKNLKNVGVYSEPKRDPRGRVISFAFKFIAGEQIPSAGDDAKEVKWFPLQDMPELSFDHKKIVEDATKIK